MALFQDRREAAHELARVLVHLKVENPVVLGLANGGVPVAEVIAHALDATFDVLLIERLKAPKNPNHIVGAVDEHGRISMIRSTARWHHLTSREMVEPARLAFRDLQRRRGKIRAVLPETDVNERTVIIVGQGVASGAKMLGAVASVRDRGARKVVVAAPAGSGEAAWQLNEAADLVVIPHRPSRFKSVEGFYREFTPVTDDIVLSLVERWMLTARPQQPGVRTLAMKMPNDEGNLICCEIDLPPGTTRGSGPHPTVVFAHSHESDGHNRRTVAVSRRLAKRGIMGVRADFTGHGRSEGTMEDATPARMGSDLRLIIESVRHLDEVDSGNIGLVGSGTGAALVLQVAADRGDVRAVVVRGPMEGPEIGMLPAASSPTLMIYGEQDRAFAVAASAASQLASSHHLLEIPDATRRFADSISLEMMVGATVDWLVDHMIGVGREMMEEEETPAAPGQDDVATGPEEPAPEVL